MTSYYGPACLVRINGAHVSMIDGVLGATTQMQEAGNKMTVTTLAPMKEWLFLPLAPDCHAD
jgi:hypothetical protein